MYIEDVKSDPRADLAEWHPVRWQACYASLSCLVPWLAAEVGFNCILLNWFLVTLWGASLCQDPAGNQTTWRPLDHHKEMQTAVVWSCLPFIRSCQNQLARHSERGKKTRQTEKEVGRQHQGMDGPGLRQVPEGSGEQGKMEKTGCKVICGALTTLMVKG